MDHQHLGRAALLSRLNRLSVCLREKRVARNDARPVVGFPVGVRRVERLAVALPDELVLVLDFLTEPLAGVLRQLPPCLAGANPSPPAELGRVEPRGSAVKRAVAVLANGRRSAGTAVLSPAAAGRRAHRRANSSNASAAVSSLRTIS